MHGLSGLALMGIVTVAVFEVNGLAGVISNLQFFG
jgi:hypothetical protein